MASYRLFFVDHTNHIARARVVDCPTDIEALAVAGNICGDYQAVEVWELARRVGRIDATHALADSWPEECHA